MTKMIQTLQLEINDFRQMVKLGTTAEERAIPQSILFDVVVRFNELPKAVTSDQLDDTQCYLKITQWIETVCKSEFSLIERLAFETYRILRKEIPAKYKIGMICKKEKPPISNLEGHAAFKILEWEESNPDSG